MTNERADPEGRIAELERQVAARDRIISTLTERLWQLEHDRAPQSMSEVANAEAELARLRALPVVRVQAAAATLRRKVAGVVRRRQGR